MMDETTALATIDTSKRGLVDPQKLLTAYASIIEAYSGTWDVNKMIKRMIYVYTYRNFVKEYIRSLEAPEEDKKILYEGYMNKIPKNALPDDEKERAMNFKKYGLENFTTPQIESQKDE